MRKNNHIKEIKAGNTRIGFKYGMLQVNGKSYQWEMIDGKETYVKVSEKEVKAKTELAKKLTDKLRDSLDRDKVLMEALMSMPPKELKKLENLLFKSKKVYKPKTRADACVDMKVGNFILPIIA